MMRLRLCFLFFFLILRHSATAFPALVERGDCDSIACPLGGVWDGVAGAAAATLGGTLWLGNEFLDLFKSPEPPNPQTSDPPATPVIPAQGEINSDGTQQSSEPTADINLSVTATATPQLTKQEECQSPSILNENSGSDQVASDTSSCEVATAQLVFLSSCDDLAQNQIIQNMLEEMEILNEKIGGVLVSMAPMCATTNGAGFIMADLTPSQIQTIGGTAGVQAVEPDQPLDSGDLTDDDPTDENDSDTGPARKKRNHLDKRDDVVLQAQANAHLRYLSTGHFKYEASKNYAYFLSARPRITTYVMERSFDPKHDEFTSVNIDWIFASKASEPEKIKPFHGTCITSLIVGRRFGVYKNGDIVLIRIGENLGTLLNGLSQMIVRLLAQILSGKKVKGYTVLNISYRVTAKDEALNKMKEYLSILMRVFQVVVVTVAGNAPGKTGAAIAQWPALFSLESDVITVGSVSAEALISVKDGEAFFGQPYPWSRVGPALTISAPGQFQCARNTVFQKPWFLKTGTSGSGAIVSGLIAYFLDLPLGDRLRQADNIPLAVKNYIKTKGSVRQGVLSVWNGLDGDKPGRDNQYGWDGEYGLAP